ncbi:hypothetical protein CFR75_05890 [Komagataeibacter xylinus]|uniref:Uncharacterized protein n=1 Tax=Komagataeibacter xylinus TaxID=28448 RepID=A0A318PJG1_KOMXY|nr:hypothetical protein [Komagataeibacter xylinus]AZV39110.1 hypothetical protein CXP35_10285 [Komagataeibacter xylinus]PYD57564.1 hypothetical protein CFR75_05890 [Komagataeibacter xylinus]GBQ72671.1 hypothetical protein AA15237_1407 [Komagataeibacter xylinus NBRC 15237]
MSHNYATPLTPEKRLARVLARIPAPWGIHIERLPGVADTARWQARLDVPGQAAPAWTAPAPTMVDALEQAWRQARALLA